MSGIKDALMADIKACMKSGEKDRLAVLRLISAAVKQKEVDERVAIDDSAMLTILDKMAKQRRESIEQFKQGGRDDLASVEQSELAIIQNYLPKQLTEAEVELLIDEAIRECGASEIKHMGKVMGSLKSKLQGRADMGAVSAIIKARLSA